MLKLGLRTLGIFLGCLSLAWAFPLTGRSAEADFGELTGRVLAPDGSGLPGATVILTSLQTGAVLRAVTGDGGMYRISKLPSGTYDLRVEAPGFNAESRRDVAFASGGSRTLDFKLAFATIREAIEVIGTAPRTSLESSEVRESSARDIGEAVSQTTGVWKVRKGGIANDIVLRGFRSKDLNVLVDGERIYGACPNHMDPSAFHADFAEVDHVEISKGPYDMRHQGSLAGIVNIVTRKPELGWNARASMSGGSYRFMNPSLTVSHGSGAFTALGGFSYRASRPYEDGSNRSFVELANYLPRQQRSDAFRVWTAWGRSSFKPGKDQILQVAYTRQEADHVQYPYLLMDAIYDNTDRAQIGYRIDRPVGPLDWIHAQAYFTRVDHWMTDRYRVSSANMAREYSMGTHATTRAIGVTLEAGIGRLTLGLESFRRHWDAQTLLAGMAYRSQASIPCVVTQALGMYALYGWDVNERLRLDLGGRIDTARTEADGARANTNLYFAYNSSRATRATDSFPSGSLRLTYKLAEGLEATAGMGHAVRIPDAVERYFGLQRKGTDWVGNPGLRPSRNTGFDIAITARHRGLFVGATLFHNRVSDYIQVVDHVRTNTVPGIMNMNARSYKNVDARLYGGELEAVYPLTRRLIISSDVSYVRGTQEPNLVGGIRSRNLAEIPPLRSRTRLRYDTGGFFAEVEGILAAAQRDVNIDLLEGRTPGYGIANFLVGFRSKKFTIEIIVSNILDKLYYENLSYQRDPFRSGIRVYEPGANGFVNFSYHFGAR